MAANLNSTLKNLGALCDRHGEGSGFGDLSNLKRQLENPGQSSLADSLARLKADLGGQPSQNPDNQRSENRLNRVMSR